MHTTLLALLGIGSMLAVGTAAPAFPAANLAPTDTVALASKLVGRWTGTRFDSSNAAGQNFMVNWKKTPDGLLGTVRMADGSSYATRVVWSSDTAFITESAPHQNAMLHEQVVTRTVSHLKGDSLTGTYELRPDSYKGRTAHGRFAAARST